MPPKRQFKDESSEDDSSDDTTTTSSADSSSNSEEGGAREVPPTVSGVDSSNPQKGGTSIANNPHDLAFEVEDDGGRATPPEGQGGDDDDDDDDGTGIGGAVAGPAAGARPSAASGGARGSVTGTGAAAPGGRVLANNPNDEVFDADDGRTVRTPPKDGAGAAAGAAGPGRRESSLKASSSNVLKNDAHDEFSDVEDDMEEDVETPARNRQPAGGAGAAGGRPGGVVKNMPHDEAESVEGGSVASPSTQSLSPERGHPAAATSASPQQRPGGASQGQQRGQGQPPQQGSMMSGGGESSSDVSTDDDDDGESAPRMGQSAAAAAAEAGPNDGSATLYNPADYAHLYSKVPREVSDLFALINAYQPTALDLPAKFRPFIPDYMPCVGDIDTFCKVPRPDGAPDNLGLVVVDEPSMKQSNPAVVKIGLTYVSKVTGQSAVVESLADAHSRPQAIDSWVNEIKAQHKNKPLPTVSYAKPMPEIDELLQVWPQAFEDFLSSDVQFPPPNIDLDIEQYVRVMCIILDIPVYENVIESLHLMFTLFLEFRANQHFQHN